MNHKKHDLASNVSSGAMRLLHICLPIIVISLIAAAIYCVKVGKHDLFMGKYLFFEAIQYSLASIIIATIGAMFIDIGERERKMH